MRFTQFSPVGVLVLFCILAACGSNNSVPFSTPLSPSPVPTAAPPSAPAAYTLSGLVFESTANGRVPVEGVHVYCDGCGSPFGHTSVFTSADGLYSFGWAYNSTLPLLVQKDGYTVAGAIAVLSNGMARRMVTINGDTQFDIELIRR
jgi:hypothetical protein